MTVVLLVGVAAVLLFLWTQSREEYFASRYFRVLGRISEHIEQVTLARYDVIYHAVRSRKWQDIKNLNLESDIDVDVPAPPPETAQPDSCDASDVTQSAIALELVSRGSSQRLVVTDSGPLCDGSMSMPLAQPVRIVTDLGPLIERVIRSSLTSPFEHGSRFDYLVVADAQGKRILFAPEGAAGRVGSLDELRDSLGNTVAPDLQAEAVDVVFEGRAYKLFVSALTLAFEPLAPSQEVTEWTWRVAGLVSADRFRSDALEIHYALLITAVYALLLLVVSFAVIELKFRGSREGYSRHRLARLMVSVVMATSLTTLMIVDYIAYGSVNAITNTQLDDLGKKIASNFQQEWESLAQLASDLASPSAIEAVLDGAQASFSVLGDEQKTKLLGESGRPSNEKAARSETISWTNADGTQRAKWSTRRRVPPLINIAGRAYFQDALRATLTSDPDDTEQTGDPGYEPSTIEIIRSMTTGETRIAISQPVRDGRDEHGVAVVAVMARMGSIVEPVLPDGYRFAILDRDGTVLLHSDLDRLPGDNLIEEAERDRDLLTALQGRKPSRFNISYEGNYYRVRLAPLTADWLLALMRDTRQMHSSNIQVLWISTAVLSVAFALLFLLFYLLQRWMQVQIVWMLENEKVDPILWTGFRHS